uniref:Autophagy protein 5 n=1 Tax=Romanomermis culicivorax TaxID=13658 RepID=A0A915J3Z4_ROMCU
VPISKSIEIFGASSLNFLIIYQFLRKVALACDDVLNLMSEDLDVRREIWRSRIPIEFCFIAAELNTVDTPKASYMLVSRLTYLPLLKERLKKHIRSILNYENNIDGIWFEFNGFFLKWYYPVGVLYDYYGAKSIPWSITVHVKNYPENELECDDKCNVEFIFIQTLKEADQMKHRGHVIENLQCHDYKQLWNNFIYERFDQFYHVSKPLSENTIENPIRYIPIRVYLPDRFKFVQKLVKPFRISSESADGGAAPTAPTTLQDILPKFYGRWQIDQFLVISHGISLPFETPVLWLVENLCYPDNFVHLCICVVDR